VITDPLNKGHVHNVAEVPVLPINPDGSLGTETIFGSDGSLEFGQVDSLWLSPDERFLFTNNTGGGVLTFQFSEDPSNITLKPHCGAYTKAPGLDGFGTEMSFGSGGLLYGSENTADENNNSASYVAVFTIDQSTGCPTAVPNSPFETPLGGTNMLAAWPPPHFSRLLGNRRAEMSGNRGSIPKLIHYDQASVGPGFTTTDPGPSLRSS